MIAFLDGLSFILEWVYVFVFFRIWYSFLPLRKNRIMKILAVIPFSFMAVCVIYSNELTNLTFLLIGMIVYVIVFHRGAWVEKATAVLIFYPALVAVNYLMLDSGMKFFYFYSGLPYGEDSALYPETLLSSTVIHTMTLLFRLLFWIGAGAFLKKYFEAGSRNLTIKMWLVIDGLMASSFLAVFTIIYLMPEQNFVAYPICGTAIFASFGCIYLVYYICESVKTAYRAKALASQQTYYQERIEDERWVRSIYHDLKNHLLVLQAQSNSRQGQEAIQSLQEQVEMYESYYQTGNETLNVLLRDKARIAREKSIDFSAIVHFEDGKFLEPLDISTIFGNALDNAIEASEKLPPDRRMITVKTSRVGEGLMILVENNALEEEKKGKPGKGWTSKPDHFLHGFGIANIRECVEKYEGECILQEKQGRFTVKIYLPVPEKQDDK